MNTIGSHPGAIIFRLCVMVLLILILVIVFFSYLDGTQKSVERSSIQQTKRIIDSSLAVVFATYAVKGRLNDLNEINGGNPFVFLAEYQMVPPAYQGVMDQDIDVDTAPGWYYLKHRKRVVYKAHYLESDSYFAIILAYEDRNNSGIFESQNDNFKNLRFIKTAEL
jgi:hypothetical protein